MRVSTAFNRLLAVPGGSVTEADHKLADKGWRTIKLGNGDTHLDYGRKTTNDYHHPERFFARDPLRS